ncbi:MAG: PQQ-binding-like beta-propeller repeat protein [Deltaproteobacteria bacterium]|nr:PQQ-binding-like beta-propeller repeat protein [Deltaproteobacteria bacterium]MBN2671243.1 PQQ-binding-like beta-propeller repeat protein [Deltaproteobacteria bacterium]
MKTQMTRKFIVPFFLSAAVIFCFGATGEICGPLFETTADAFEARFPENKADDLKKVTSKIKKGDMLSITNKTGHPIIIMTTAKPKAGLLAWDISTQKILWQIETPVNSPIVLKNNTVLLQTGINIAAYDADSGTERWRFPVEEGWSYYGADISKDTVVLSMGIGSSNDGEYANGRLMAVRLSDGKQLWQNLTGNGLLGKPATKGKYVFVPWKKKQIAVIQLDTGEEVSRIRADDYTINFVQSTAQGVFYGTNATEKHVASLFRLDQKSTTGKRVESNTFTPQISPVPNAPGFAADTFNKPSIELSTSDRIRFYWLAKKSNVPFQFYGNVYYLHYWRYIIAFDADTHQVRWTYMSDEDLHTLHAVKDGIFAITTSGTLQYADAKTGKTDWVQASGITPTSVAFDIQGYTPKVKLSGETPNPRKGLKRMIIDKDTRMLPIRIYATELLSDIDDSNITGDLLQLYADATLPAALQKKIVEKLAERETGAEALIASLDVHYDFLNQTSAPPMSVIAPALANMGAQKALNGLLSQLLNYETPTQNIEAIASSVLKLGNETVVTPLFEFITLYHADSSFIGNESGLARICEVVLKFGGASYKPKIAEIRDEPQTLPELKKQLLTILDPNADQKAMAAAIKKAQEAEIARQKALELKAAQEIANRPYYLTRDQISKTIARNAHLLRPCIKNALEKRLSLTQVRMKFSITGETGKPSGLQVLPPDIPGLQQCLSDALTEIEFPKFKNLRQSASHTIRITGVKRPKPDEFE